MPGRKPGEHKIYVNNSWAAKHLADSKQPSWNPSTCHFQSKDHCHANCHNPREADWRRVHQNGGCIKLFYSFVPPPAIYSTQGSCLNRFLQAWSPWLLSSRWLHSPPVSTPSYFLPFCSYRCRYWDYTIISSDWCSNNGANSVCQLSSIMVNPTCWCAQACGLF